MQNQDKGDNYAELKLLDANDSNTLNRPDAPDPTAWGLHGSMHRYVPHARCIMHVHSMYSTVLASLADSRLLPIDLNTATFFNRYVIDEQLTGLAFESEGERCARLFSDPQIKIMIMGNHGLLVLGDSVSETFNRLYYFERAAETYIKALQTQQPLRLIDDETAEQIAKDIERYPDQAERHLADIHQILQRSEPDYLD